MEKGNIMEEVNRVTVKISGQEYTISGEMSREYIIRVADYVDRKMQEISQMLPTATTVSLAVLSAVNAADDYFSLLEETRSFQDRCTQLEKDAAHYVQLWDEAKKGYLQYKEDARASQEHRQQLQQLFNEKTAEYSKLLSAYDELKKQQEALLSACDELKKQQEALLVENEQLRETAENLRQNAENLQQNLQTLQNQQSQQPAVIHNENEELISQLENKCKDIESSFFDLQMENIRLKGELDQYKKTE